MSPAFTLLVMALPTMAAVRVWMHPDARAERAHRRLLAAQRNHCGGRCTTADNAQAAQLTAKCPCGCGRSPGQHSPPFLPRQRTPQEN